MRQFSDRDSDSDSTVTVNIMINLKSFAFVVIYNYKMTSMMSTITITTSCLRIMLTAKDLFWKKHLEDSKFKSWYIVKPSWQEYNPESLSHLTDLTLFVGWRVMSELGKINLANDWHNTGDLMSINVRLDQAPNEHNIKRTINIFNYMNTIHQNWSLLQ